MCLSLVHRLGIGLWLGTRSHPSAQGWILGMLSTLYVRVVLFHPSGMSNKKKMLAIDLLELIYQRG